jgi:hypothetical protein
MNRRSSRLVGAGVALALVLPVVACGSDEPAVVQPPPPATLAQLVGPWQPSPFSLNDAAWTRIEAGCRRDMGMRPGARALIIDARGGGVATVRMTGQQAGHCDALQITANGDVMGAGGGMVSDAAEQPMIQAGTAIGPIEQTAVEGGELSMRGWSAYGPVGSGIASVTVEVPGQPLILATVMNGQFAAWWPVSLEPLNPPNGRGGQPPPDLSAPSRLVVRGYDATGTLVNQIGE